MRPENFDVHEMIDQLTGTCQSMDDVLPERMDFEDLTGEDCATIDENIFCCQTCNWWHEIESQSEDNPEECVECAESEND